MRPTEYAALDAYRLEKDWTWPQLAAAMAEAGAPISSRTLYLLLKSDHAGYDRTLHKVRRFLAHVRATDTAAFERAGAFTAGDAHA